MPQQVLGHVSESFMTVLIFPYSPTVDANHDHARKVETDTAGDDGIRGCQVQCACGILLAIILKNQRLVGSMDPQRDGHKRDESGQQPNSCNGYNSHPACHPTAVSVMKVTKWKEEHINLE